MWVIFQNLSRSRKVKTHDVIIGRTLTFPKGSMAAIDREYNLCEAKMGVSPNLPSDFLRSQAHRSRLSSAVWIISLSEKNPSPA